MLRVSDIDKCVESIGKASQTVVEDFASYTAVNLSSQPRYIAVSADSTSVAVCFNDHHTNVIQLYDILGFKAPVILPFHLHLISALVRTALSQAVLS